MLAPTWVVITPVAVPVTGSPPALGSAWRCWCRRPAVAVTSMTTLTVAPGMVTLPETVAPVRLKLAVLAPPCTLLVILAALAVKLAGKL